MKNLFERVHNKVAYTMCKLMFGDEFVDSYVNYGDNYFLTTPEQETKNYKSLKDAGAPEGMLHSNLERIIATTYKTAPYTALLNQIYLEIEPYQTMSVENVTKLVGVSMIPKSKALAKIHFTDFIEDFEAQHYALVKMIELGEIDKDEVVKKIKNELKEYISKVANEIEEDYKQEQEREEEKLDKEASRQNNNGQMPDISKPSSVEKRSMPYRSGEDKD
jgi:gas vesicle protein